MAVPALDIRTVLSENTVLRGRDQDSGEEHFLRVLHLPHQSDEVALASISDPLCFPFWLNLKELCGRIEREELELCDDPMRATLRRDSVLSHSEIAERDRRWCIIKPLVVPMTRPDLNSRVRQLHIKARVDELRSTPNAERLNALRADKVVEYLRLYWRRGQIPNALIPEYRRRGGPGKERLAPPDSQKRGRKRYDLDRHLIPGVNVTDEVRKKLIGGVAFLRMRGVSRRNAYEKTLDKFFSVDALIDGLPGHVRWPVSQLPSFAQFVYWTGKVLNREERLLATEGPYLYAQRRRPRLGSTQGLAFGPGSVFQIDATIADVYLRCRDDPGRLLGRPVVYIVIDMYSRIIVGFFVALSGPSWEVASWALENAFSDKVEFCASLGIKIRPSDWPSHHVCRELMGDRGWDHLCKSAGAAADGLGYKLSNLPPYRPDLKGMVEGRFAFLTGMMKWMPGVWRARARGEPRNKLDGAYTLDEFRAFLALKILEHNRTHGVSDPPMDWDSANGRTPTPLALFNHGCRTQGAPMRADLIRIRANLLHVGRARETDRGLRFRRLHYIPEKPDSELERWFVRLPGGKWRDREVRWQPGTVSCILLPIDGGEGFIVFTLHPGDARFMGWTFEEVEEWYAAQRADELVATDERNAIKAEYNAMGALLDRQAREAGSGHVTKTRYPVADKGARTTEANRMRAKREAPGGFVSVTQPARPEPSQSLTEGSAGFDHSPVTSHLTVMRPRRIELFRKRRAAHDEIKDHK